MIPLDVALSAFAIAKPDYHTHPVHDPAADRLSDPRNRFETVGYIVPGVTGWCCVPTLEWADVREVYEARLDRL